MSVIVIEDSELPSLISSTAKFFFNTKLQDELKNNAYMCSIKHLFLNFIFKIEFK